MIKYIFNNPGNLIPDPIKQRPFRRKDLGWKILWYSSSCIWDKELIFLTVSSPVTVGSSAICWDTESSLSGYFWMCFEWLVNSTSYSVKRFVLGLWCQGIQGFVEGGQVYPAHTVSGPCGEVICLTWRYQTACLPLLVIFEHRGQKKQWWHLSWAIMISPYNENVTYCSMTLCGPPQDDESWGPYVLPKKKKASFLQRRENVEFADKKSACRQTFILIFHCTVCNGKMPARMSMTQTADTFTQLGRMA